MAIVMALVSTALISLDIVDTVGGRWGMYVSQAVRHTPLLLAHHMRLKQGSKCFSRPTPPVPGNIQAVHFKKNMQQP